MTATAIVNSPLTSTDRCVHCFHPLDHFGRFCGECGAPSSKSRKPEVPATPAALAAAIAPSKYETSFIASFQQTPTVMHQHEAPTAQALVPPAPLHKGEDFSSRPARVEPQRTPSFAQVSSKISTEVPNELREEINNLVCLLLRERMFLFIHWGIFLSMNLLGLFLSITAYNGYNGDELTKSVIAMTPLMFINTIALACLAPIKGTKREIARLRERLSYVRFQVEYHNMF
jgi:hypothetical protein